MKRIALAVLVLALGTSSARAEEEQEGPDYMGSMVLTDLAILMSAGPVVAASEGREGETALLYGLAYLTAGPIIHAINGNSAKVGRSFAKRLLLPIGLGAVGAAVGLSAVRDCTGEMCVVGVGVAGAVGAGVGLIAAVISDWSTAHHDLPKSPVTPMVSVHGERVSVGLGGRF